MNESLGILHISLLFFEIEKEIFLSKDFLLNSLQDVDIVIILDNLDYSGTYDIID